MALLSRRRILLGLAGAAGAAVTVRVGLPAYIRHAPPEPLDDELQKYVDACFSDVDRSKVWDIHAHLVGRGVGTGCFISAEMTSKLHPWKNFQYDIYAAAAGVPTDDRVPDSAYLERLLALHRLANPQGKIVLMAFDMYVDEQGNEVRERSELYTPNEYVLDVANKNSDVIACASVHPYRKDAIERLTRAIDAGARMIKWLPNAMHIDLESPKCARFFRVLADRRVPLLTHTGDEAAVDARDLQVLGDPKKLRAPLDAGVTVVAAHVATTGECGDTSCFARLRAMMKDHENLYADISAITQFNRAGKHLGAILEDDELHARLLNGSDYPLPAIDPLVSTRFLVQSGLLSADDRERVNRVFKKNPLLFDFVLKRKVQRNGKRFPPKVFETSWLFA